MNASELLAPLLWVIAAAPGGACTQDPPAGTTPEAPPAPPSIVLDGAFDEWPEGVLATADDEWLSLRLSGDPATTLQGGQVSAALWIDVDGRAQSGRKEGDLGVDLEILFSPPSDRRPGPRAGIEIRAVGEHAIHEVVSHAAIGLAFAPTFASESYELRIARRTSLKEPVGSRWHRSEHVRGKFVRRDAGGAIVAEQPFDLELERAAPPADPAGRIPPRIEGAVRVMSWNIERAAPRENPKPFARVLAALDPDVVLLQEWWETSEKELLAWFSANAPSRTPWRAITFGELGCAVLTRLPAVPLLAAPLDPLRRVDDRDPRPVRFVGATVETAAGPLICGSLHLKARGHAGSWEDRLRVVEAETIRARLASALEATPDAALVVAGDWNLVGSDRPLDALRRALDRDGSDLEPIDANVLGDRSLHTWTHAESSFTPGRLDWIVTSDSVLETRQAFVLDTARLADDALRAGRLKRDDSRATDHLPLVVDLAEKGTGGGS
ncbi:MAG: endonuclease/exonuclease/phosphatase family protein [Planctomycetota bacterium JB042]